MDIKLLIKDGKELTKDELDVINLWREKEFNSKSVIEPKLNDDNWNKKYFLLFEGINKLVAFARLHEVKLEFLGEEYSILGLATLISTERRKGYGKRLVLEMKRYIELSGKAGIGFCNKKLTEFYKDCGFGIIVDGTSRFLYKDNNNLVKDPWGGGDVIYVEGKDGLITKILENPGVDVISHRKHW